MKRSKSRRRKSVKVTKVVSKETPKTSQAPSRFPPVWVTEGVRVVSWSLPGGDG